MQSVKSVFQQKPSKLKPFVLLLASSFFLGSMSCFAQVETGDSASPATLMAPPMALEKVPETLPQIPADTVTQPATEDLTAASSLVQRLKPYLHSDAVWTRYQAQKARMWLVYADSERSQRGITQAAAQAEAEAVKLLEQLEQNRAISPTTPIIASSQVLRRDLWATAELLKQQAGFDCAADELAHAEVTLVWAAAQHCELGWRHSRELFAAAERWMDSASYQAASCHGAVASVTPLARVNYPSLAELNGTQKGCHGVVGQWPIIASPAAATAFLATVPAEVAANASGSAGAVDAALDNAPMKSMAVNPVAVDPIALNVPYQEPINQPVQPQTQSQEQQ